VAVLACVSGVVSLVAVLACVSGVVSLVAVLACVSGAGSLVAVLGCVPGASRAWWWPAACRAGSLVVVVVACVGPEFAGAGGRLRVRRGVAGGGVVVGCVPGAKSAGGGPGAESLVVVVGRAPGVSRWSSQSPVCRARSRSPWWSPACPARAHARGPQPATRRASLAPRPVGFATRKGAEARRARGRGAEGRGMGAGFHMVDGLTAMRDRVPPCG
jgi:hypothetical protein